MRDAIKLIFPVRLKENKKAIVAADFKSLVSMFTPGMLFALGMLYLAATNEKFQWLLSPARYPVELWIIACFGSIASVGGIGDWIFHRIFVAAGPKERQAHLLALASGGIPLFVLMAVASIIANPLQLLIPILCVLIYTTSLSIRFSYVIG